MSEVVVDSSESVDVLDESTLLPLSESAGMLADDPALDSEFAEPGGNSDEVAFEPGEEPGQETRPDDAVKSADEVDPDGGQ
ncbi:hypothetical protein ACIBL3_44490 [Kribbella sp. NPDC050124]|uniref:hypothetical protein n=1 Tax=Kribbella sp. NPDC050124 TaxID=3364114 RepID=UPI00378E6E45